MKKAIILAAVLVLAFALALPAPCIGQNGQKPAAIVTGQGTVSVHGNISNFSISAAQRGEQMITIGRPPDVDGHLILSEDVIGNVIHASPYCTEPYQFDVVGVGGLQEPFPTTFSASVYFGGPGEGVIIFRGLPFVVNTGGINCRQLNDE